MSDAFAGRELTDDDLSAALSDLPGTAVFTYRRMKLAVSDSRTWEKDSTGTLIMVYNGS